MWFFIYSTCAFLVILVLLISNLALYYKFTSVKCKSTKRLEGKTVIVTGSSTGIGYEVARDLARRGARVIVTCPFQEEGAKAANTIAQNTNSQSVVFKYLDLSSLESVREFANDVIKNEPRLDLLINNAGVMGPDVTTKDGLNFIMQVNYFGHFLLTILLLPLLKKSGTNSEPSRIINTSSMAHTSAVIQIKRLNSTGYYKTTYPFYAISKLCLSMFTRELAKRLKDTNVVVNTADPRISRTSILDGIVIVDILNVIFGPLIPTSEDGAQTTLHLALDTEAGSVSGEYYDNCKISKASKKVYDEEKSLELWKKSIVLVQLSERDIMSALLIK